MNFVEINTDTDTNMEDCIPQIKSVKRQYNLSSPDDVSNYEKGFCPNYALKWGITSNVKYWSHGHHFINPECPNNISPEIHKRILQKMSLYIQDKEKYEREQKSVLVFCELDNIFYNYDEAINKYTGLYPQEQSKNDINSVISRVPRFYQDLKLNRTAYVNFWGKLIKLNTSFTKETTNKIPIKPIILTNSPDFSLDGTEKVDWCKEHLGPNFRLISTPDERELFPNYDYYIIITQKTNKHLFSTPNSVLIDTDITQHTSWQSKGGLFCHYSKNNAENILDQLHMAFDI